MESIAGRLRDLRQRKARNQTWLASRMQERGHAWHQSTVAKIETGRRPVRLDEAAAIAEIFCVTLENLLGVDPGPVQRHETEGELRERIAAEITGRPGVAALCTTRPAPRR